VVSTPGQICNSPLNNSRSKMLFSFPKAKKMGESLKSTCSQAFYDLPPVRESRTTAFGYGHKFDFTKGHGKTPAPNAYVPSSIFDDKTKKRGYSFGLSREAMLVTGGQYIGEKKSPGPGAYNTREINKTLISFSFRPRTNTEGSISSKTIPGPGAYATIGTIDPKGKYNVSKFKNSGAAIIAPSRSQRWAPTKETKEPGPGAYDLKTGINTTGAYFVSKFKSNIARSFGNSMRKTGSGGHLDIPGPGSYRLPSEFGHYEAPQTKSVTKLTSVETKRSKSPEKSLEKKE